MVYKKSLSLGNRKSQLVLQQKIFASQCSIKKENTKKFHNKLYLNDLPESGFGCEILDSVTVH